MNYMKIILYKPIQIFLLPNSPIELHKYDGKLGVNIILHVNAYTISYV